MEISWIRCIILFHKILTISSKFQVEALSRKQKMVAYKEISLRGASSETGHDGRFYLIKSIYLEILEIS